MTEAQDDGAKRERHPTTYVVLKQGANDGMWLAVDTEVAAVNAKQAVREYAAKGGGDPEQGVYIAVPTRSWAPVTVSVETQTAIKLA